MMSAKARLGWLISTAYRSLVASAPPPRTALVRASGAESQRPHGAVAGAASQEDVKTIEEEDDEEEVPAARAPRKKAAPRDGAQIIRKVRTAVGLGA